ncbi:RNA polymerase sigma factor RpoE [Desulfocucumis palustris]|uniref:RNA polymerase sigma factor RpoE n=1 Tax=Desulfocucumis palustris TaxID=1898651 RepID=A0A2L2XDH7_9FIRM|nr:sigma-70 family RNA polymerase sigma factor [Desulfocucumis palustris]GBF33773.1 RNA polymerase sigma factor RpoE [Desulfocucumis palustris]
MAKELRPDDVLVQKSKNGDLDAFDELVKKYESKIYTVAYRFTSNHADANDLAQETFIRVYQSLGTFRGDSSFATWLYRIAANVCRDELRRQQRRKKVSLDEIMSHPGGNIYLADEASSPEESLERNELQRAVQKCLNTLSEEQRLILVMREIQGLSYEEIAASLDCSLGTVKSRLSRSRQALKQKVLGDRELSNIVARQLK